MSFLNRFGRPAGRLETIQPLAHLCFLADRPFLVGAAAFGMLVGVEVDGSRTSGRLDPEIAWQDRLISNVGRLTVSGDGGMILASCFTHGIQRFDLQGRNEGSYHLGGTVSHAVPDFPGRTIAAATLEGELAIMNSAGNVRWRTRLPRPAIALEIDPLGRYVIYGIFDRRDRPPRPVRSRARLAARTAARHGGTRRPAAGARRLRTATGSVRRPDWTVPAVVTHAAGRDGRARGDRGPRPRGRFSPARIGFSFTRPPVRSSGQGPDMDGVGRILRTAPGWLAAATDRQIVLCDLRRSTHRRLDVSLVELTHLAIRPDSFGLALVQERDRIGRVTASGRWVWKRELKSPVEDLAIGPEGFAAVTTDDGQLLIFDPAGEPTVGSTFDPTDPPSAHRGSRCFALGRRLADLEPTTAAGHRARPARQGRVDPPASVGGLVAGQARPVRDRLLGRWPRPGFRSLRDGALRGGGQRARPTTFTRSTRQENRCGSRERGVHLICASPRRPCSLAGRGRGAPRAVCRWSAGSGSPDRPVARLVQGQPDDHALG